MVVAEAQFSKTRQEENVFYVGAFGKWVNVHQGLMRMVLDMDKKLVSSPSLLFAVPVLAIIAVPRIFPLNSSLNPLAFPCDIKYCSAITLVRAEASTGHLFLSRGDAFLLALPCLTERPRCRKPSPSTQLARSSMVLLSVRFALCCCLYGALLLVEHFIRVSGCLRLFHFIWLISLIAEKPELELII